MVFRGDGTPSYQLSCVVDDAAMGITEVVRGADLLTSTCRQLLLYRALGLPEPAFFHTPLVLDANGVRLAKRHDALSIRSMREAGATPHGLREGWEEPRVYAGSSAGDDLLQRQREKIRS
jgi:glutamyl-tRNA synthetase